jgi:ABC-type sugar transport system substrate-binding protein
MKKTTTIAALSAAALLGAAPLLVSADDDDREKRRYEHRTDGTPMNANPKQFSTDEMRIMAYGQALRRFGPGVVVSVNETADGTVQVQLRDAEQNLIREQEFNQYGAPVPGSHQN